MKNNSSYSICPKCREKIPAVKYVRGNQVYMKKSCPKHGDFEYLISKDAARFFDKTFSVEGKSFSPCGNCDKGCPESCGWCDKHEQHICTGLIEVTDSCNFSCPICYFGPKEAHHINIEEFSSRLQTLLKVENGTLDVLQISGGECTLHPQIIELLDTALAEKVNRILINTNGRRLLQDDRLFEKIKQHRDRIEIYLQFDGFDDNVYQDLRGQKLLAEKLRIIDKLDENEIKICLAVTVYERNLKELPEILHLSYRVKNISGITFQRLTKVGSARSSSLVSVCQEDILLALQNSGLLQYKDLIQLPCSHENCTSLGFLFCSGDKVYSLGNYVDFSKCKDTISNRIAFDKTILDYMRKNVCKCFVSRLLGSSFLLEKLQDFAQGEGSCQGNMKIVRIIVKNFMDETNFDFERARKCCVGVSIGKGKVVPFCVHNALKGIVKW